MIFRKILFGLGATSLSVSAHAQTAGILTYGPVPLIPIPVPIPSLIVLPLSIAVAFIGYLALKKGAGKGVLGVFTLILGAGLFMFSGLQIQQAIAQAGLELSNPQGGSVEIPQADATYTNTSGVSLRIESVIPPPLCTSTAPADECVPELRLEHGQSCSTAYDCPGPQTISFTSTPPTDAVINGTPYEVAATATSGLPVSFSTASAACSVAGSTVTFDTEGTCVIDADQSGNDEFLPAPQVQQSFEVSRQSQSITFTSTPPADAVVNGGPYEVAATASSGLPVSFSTSSAACSVAGSTVTFDTEGTCVIDADQSGNDEFLPAPQVQQSFAIAPPRITFEQVDPVCSFGAPPTGCNAEPLSEFSISPACDANGWTVTVDWDQDANGTIDQQNVSTLVSGNGADYTVTGAYPFGSHLFKVSAEDTCGTVLTADISFEIIDCKAPSPICINGLAIELIQGAGVVFASDFLASPLVDCSPPVDFSISQLEETPDRSNTALNLSCDDLGTAIVRIYGWDQVDNNDFCETYVLVQDNQGSCSP